MWTVGARKAKDIRDSYERTWSSNCAVEVEVEGAFLSEGVIVSIESITLDEVENHIVLHSEGLDSTMYHVCSPQVIGPPTIEYPVTTTPPYTTVPAPDWTPTAVPSHYWGPRSYWPTGTSVVEDAPIKYGGDEEPNPYKRSGVPIPKHKCLGDFEVDTASTDASWTQDEASPCQCECKEEN